MSNTAREATREATTEILVSARANVSAELTVPEDARAVIVVAGARHVPRAPSVVEVAKALRARAPVATIVLDLVAPDEPPTDEPDALLELRIPTLAERLSGAADLAAQDARTGHLPLAFVAVGVAGAAALLASTMRPVRAVVTLDGRADLAGDGLESLVAPTLFVVDERDELLLARNRTARGRVRGPNELAVLPGGPRSDEADARAHAEMIRRTWSWLEKYAL